jgi:hypothetical protein
VWVASRFFMRWRGEEPQERELRQEQLGSGKTLEQSEVHERMHDQASVWPGAWTAGRPRRPARQGTRSRRDRQPIRDTAVLDKTLKDTPTARGEESHVATRTTQLGPVSEL